MGLIKNATELFGIKDTNIIISFVFYTDTHIEIQVKFDYPVPLFPIAKERWLNNTFKNLLKFLFLNKLELQHYYV